jgi:sortase B
LDKLTKKILDLRIPMIERLRAKSTLVAKVSVAAFAVLTGIAFILVCVYTIIPGMIANASSKVDARHALTLYERTVRYHEDTSQPVFEQPGETLAITEPRSCFSAVLDENPDIVGRISIEALGITYLVTQADDNEHYLVTGYDGAESKSGAIFLDYRCDAAAQPLCGHYIIYGHNMKNGTMFHNLTAYKDADTFYHNRIIRFDTLYADYEWEIFSAYVTDTNFYFIDTEFIDDLDWCGFLDTIREKSMHETDTELLADDVILTLSTCSYEFDDARFVVHARLIQPEG